MDMRLMRICRTRASSPRTREGTSGATRNDRRNPFSCARGRNSATQFSTISATAKGWALSTSFPASILEKSKISSISRISARAECSIARAYVSCSG